MPPNESHFRKLEQTYLAAPTNQYYKPRVHIAEGEAEIVITVDPRFYHAADAVHGSVYFKALDDAAFFAVNSQQLVSVVFSAVVFGTCWEVASLKFLLVCVL